eukprot:g4975.t1
MPGGGPPPRRLPRQRWCWSWLLIVRAGARWTPCQVRGTVQLTAIASHSHAAAAQNRRDWRETHRVTRRSGWMHLTPVVELGSLLVAGCGAKVALERPELHRALALVVEHGGGATRALLLNRPAAPPLASPAAATPLQRLALSPDAVDGQPLPGVQILEEAGAANGHHTVLAAVSPDAEDAEVAEAELVLELGGELTWTSKAQLQRELEEELWLCASLDCQALLDLLTPSSSSSALSDGGACVRLRADAHAARDAWRRAAVRLGVTDSDVDVVGDELLEDWLSQSELGARSSMRLFPREEGDLHLRRGDLLLTNARAFASGQQQFLHKALLIVLAVDGDEVFAVCLNRPGRAERGTLRRTLRSSPIAVRSSTSTSATGFGVASRAGGRGGNGRAPPDFDRWTCLATSTGDTLPEDAVPLGDSGLWWCRDAGEAWRTRRFSPMPMLFARGAVHLGSLELELSLRRGEMGRVSRWSPELRDLLQQCVAYQGAPGGVRLGLYGDHHGFGLWEAAVSLAFHQGDDQAATAQRGAVGDRTLRHWFLRTPDLGCPEGEKRAAANVMSSDNVASELRFFTLDDELPLTMDEVDPCWLLGFDGVEWDGAQLTWGPASWSPATLKVGDVVGVLVTLQGELQAMDAGRMSGQGDWLRFGASTATQRLSQLGQKVGQAFNETAMRRCVACGESYIRAGMWTCAECTQLGCRNCLSVTNLHGPAAPRPAQQILCKGCQPLVKKRCAEGNARLRLQRIDAT